MPELVLAGVPFQIEVMAVNDRGDVLDGFAGRAILTGISRRRDMSGSVELTFAQGRATAADL
ncbi:MAG: hypothetical protein ACWGQW_24055, partial [bacterium]